jgi:hypothetical protein
MVLRFCSESCYEEVYMDLPILTCKYKRPPLTFQQVSAGLNPQALISVE